MYKLKVFDSDKVWNTLDLVSKGLYPKEIRRVNSARSSALRQNHRFRGAMT